VEKTACRKQVEQNKQTAVAASKKEWGHE